MYQVIKSQTLPDCNPRVTSYIEGYQDRSSYTFSSYLKSPNMRKHTLYKNPAPTYSPKHMGHPFQIFPYITQ